MLEKLKKIIDWITEEDDKSIIRRRNGNMGGGK